MVIGLLKTHTLDLPSASWAVGLTRPSLEWFKPAQSIPVYPMLQPASEQVGFLQSWMRAFRSYTCGPTDANSTSAFLAKLPRQASSHLLGHESSFGKLLALSSATLARGAVDFDLHLSILLKGARGIGKFTIATWVAQRLGMHHLEVNIFPGLRVSSLKLPNSQINCYDIIGENDAETEGTLRARFEKAGSCSPCILILRYIEALAQTTQSPENGKGQYSLAETNNSSYRLLITESVAENILRECFSDLQNTWRLTGYPVLVFGTAAETGRIPPGVLSCFKHEVAFEVS
jgi:peroxin-6